MGTPATTTEPRVKFTLRLPPETHRRANVDAARHGRSTNDHIAAILAEHLPAAEAP